MFAANLARAPSTAPTSGYTSEFYVTHAANFSAGQRFYIFQSQQN